MNLDDDPWRNFDLEDWAMSDAEGLENWFDVITLYPNIDFSDAAKRALEESWETPGLQTNLIAEIRMNKKDPMAIAAISGKNLILCFDNPQVFDISNLRVKMQPSRRFIEVQFVDIIRETRTKFYVGTVGNQDFLEKLKILSKK